MRRFAELAALPLLLAAMLGAVRAEEKAGNPPQDRPEKPQTFGLLVYKAGERYANDKQAGESIDRFCKHLGDGIDGAEFVRRGVRNHPEEAKKLLDDEDAPTALAVVSPAFYFRHRTDYELTVLGEARRGGFEGEQYVLLGSAEAGEYPAGKRVATTLDLEPEWLDLAVLPRPEGVEPVVWVHYDNLLDAGYEIVDEEDDAPDYVLVDRLTRKAFAEDDDLAGLLASRESKLLPQDLVVEVKGRLGAKRDEVKTLLATLDATEEGREVGKLLQSGVFPAADEDRLKTAGDAVAGAWDSDKEPSK